MDNRSGEKSKVSVLARHTVVGLTAQLVLAAPVFAQLVEVAQVPGDTLSWEIPEQWVYEGSCFYVSAVNGVGLESTPTQYCLTAEDVRNSIPNPPTGLTMVKVMP